MQVEVAMCWLDVARQLEEQINIEGVTITIDCGDHEPKDEELTESIRTESKK